jgi:hypothetical protein
MFYYCTILAPNRRMNIIGIQKTQQDVFADSIKYEKSNCQITKVCTAKLALR